MLLVVTTPTESFSAKHNSIVLALVQRMPEGMTNRPRIVLLPRTSGLFSNVVMSFVKRAAPNGFSPDRHGPQSQEYPFWEPDCQFRLRSCRNLMRMSLFQLNGNVPYWDEVAWANLFRTWRH